MNDRIEIEEIIESYAPSALGPPNHQRWGRVQIKKMMQEHTDYVLDEIKWMVQNKSVFFPSGGSYLSEQDVLEILNKYLSNE